MARFGGVREDHPNRGKYAARTYGFSTPVNAVNEGRDEDSHNKSFCEADEGARN